MKYNRLVKGLLAVVLGMGMLSGCSRVKDALETGETESSEEVKDFLDSLTGDSEKSGDVETYTNNEDLLTYTYTGDAYVPIGDNIPDYTEEELEKAKTSFEEYSDLDSLGRCTQATASVGQDIMPTEKRGSISKVKPTGWQSVKYDVVPGKNLYNRCHLIGYQMTGENANDKNLITGTRYLNIDGMLDTEDAITEYVKSTGNHVLYRVTPVFKDDELVARGLRMEGYSIEDKGEGICFDYYAFNVQPGVVIKYADGTSELE